MKVLFIAPENTSTGGSFLSMIELCKQLRRRYGVIPVVATSSSGDGIELLKKANIDFFTIPFYFPTYSLEKSFVVRVKNIVKFFLLPIHYFSAWKLEKYIQKENVDLVHINTVFPLGAADAALKTGCPFVWHLREMYSKDYNVSYIQGNEYAFNLFRQADALIAISDMVNQVYEEVLHIGDKLVTVYNGISLDFYRKREILKNNVITFACIASFLKHKNHIELINACKLLREKGVTQYKVVFVGKGVLKKKLQQLVNTYKLENNIIFAGTRSDIPDFLETCDVVCVPSSSEAFGRTFVEGMLSGCLVIGAVSAFSAAEEIIDDNKTGLLYNSGNHVELAEKMEEVIMGKAKEKLRIIAKQGQKAAMHRFTSERNADEVMKVYRNVLQKRGKILHGEAEERRI